MRSGARQVERRVLQVERAVADGDFGTAAELQASSSRRARLAEEIVMAVRVPPRRCLTVRKPEPLYSPKTRAALQSPNPSPRAATPKA